MGRRRQAVVYVANRERVVRTALRDTASSPLYPLNTEQRWTPPPPGWQLLAGANKWTAPPLQLACASPPGSPVDSPERLAPSPGARPSTSHALSAPPSRAGSRELLLRPSTSHSAQPSSSSSSSPGSPPSDAGSSVDDGSIGSIRRQLFQALPMESLAVRQRWRSGNDNAAEPEPVHRQRRAVAHERRLKRKTRSVAQLVVAAAAAGDIAGLNEWMAVDGSFVNCEAALPFATTLTAPLLEAARHGHVECCQLLMHRGARTDDLAGAAPGWSALMEAAAAGHVLVINALCGFGADPLVANQTGSTALSLAAAQGHSTSVASLLALGGLLPRSASRAAAGLATVATALDALKPARKIAADSESALWDQGKQCDAGDLLSAEAKTAYEQRQRNAASRYESAKMTQAGFVWRGAGARTVQLRRDFFAWRAQTAVICAEKARVKADEMAARSHAGVSAQEFLLRAAATARQAVDEAIEAVLRSAPAASQRLETALTRALVVGKMFSHPDTDGLTPTCMAVMSGSLQTVRVMATCGAATEGNEGLQSALAEAYDQKAFSSYRCLLAAQKAARKSEAPEAFDLDVLLHLRDDTYELDVVDPEEGGRMRPKPKVAAAARLMELGPGEVYDSGSWWGEWVGGCANFHELHERCAASLTVLQPVIDAAEAVAGPWTSGPEKRGRAKAIEQQYRRVRRELSKRSMANSSASREREGGRVRAEDP